MKIGKTYTWNNTACVFGDTKITVSKTNETVNAEDIEKGDTIVYYNWKTEENEIGIVEDIYIHKNATDFVKYVFEDGTYLEATSYHPIYTTAGWKSLTQINNYEKPEIGDMVKTETGLKKLISIEISNGLEDCYDFKVIDNNGNLVNNYFANDTLVQSSFDLFDLLNK